MDVYYHGIWRMDWGLDNPNKTAALVSTLMIGVWLFAYFRKWGYWIALSLFTILGIALIHTFSRGGIIALFFGLLPILYFAPRPWPWWKIAGAGLSIWIMTGFSIYLDASVRYEQGLIKEDRSISNRVEIWRATPQMMVDAPNGWGIGNSGKAYTEWYQPLDRSEQYRTLVNSHLTWLVEVGWPMRFFYVFSWCSIFVLCWPSKRITSIAVFLGVWITFAIAAAFSSVAESPWLWLLPISCAIGAIIVRYKTTTWPNWKSWCVPFGVSATGMLLILHLGNANKGVQSIDGGTVFGEGVTSTWIVVDKKVMGQNYARTLRRYLSEMHPEVGAIGLIDSPTNTNPFKDKTVVLAGTISDEKVLSTVLASARRIILLNPFFFPQEIHVGQKANDRIAVIFGEFSQSPAINSWDAVAPVRRIPGIGDFMSQWPEIVLSVK